MRRLNILSWMISVFLLGYLLLESAETKRPDSELAQLSSALVKEIIPSRGPVRPPYDLARHDQGLIPSENFSERTPRTPALLRKKACRRQKKLEETWARLRSIDPSAANKSVQAELDLLAYAFGEGPLYSARVSAKAAGSPARLRLARLLLAECRFDKAVGELIQLAEEDSLVGRTALTILVRHAEERAVLKKHVRLLPLAIDLNAQIKEWAMDPERANVIEGVRKSSVVPVRPSDYNNFKKNNPSESDDRPDTGVGPVGADCLFLKTQSRDLFLYREDESFITGDSTVIKLRTAYNGPLDFRLYKFADKTSWQGVRAEDISGMDPVRKWQRQFKPLQHNNCSEHEEVDVPVDGLSPGYWMLMCGARYAPEMAAKKFCVSRTAFYLRTASNKCVVCAVDRVTGSKQPGVNVRLKIHGKPDLDALAKKENVSLVQAFRCGYENAEKPKSEKVHLNPQDQLEWAQAYARGQSCRQLYPEIRRTRKEKTWANGAVEFKVNLNAPLYTWTIRAEMPGGCAQAETRYKESGPKEKRWKILAWTAQPIYRPGDRVAFKGVLRQTDERLTAPWDNTVKETEVRVVCESETVWSGTCSVSEAGTFDGEFRIPQTVRLGNCSLITSQGEASPYRIFRIEEFRVPTFHTRLRFSRNTYTGGETATATVSVENCLGNPVKDAEVEIYLKPRNKTESPLWSRTGYTNASGKAYFDFPVPAVKESRYLYFHASVTDASGQSYSDRNGIRIEPNPFKVRTWISPAPAVEGSSIKLTVEAKQWSGQPVQGATVIVEGHKKSDLTNAQGRVEFALTARHKKGKQKFRVYVSHQNRVVVMEKMLNVKPRKKETVRKDSSSKDSPLRRDLLDIRHWPSFVNAGKELRFTLELDRSNGKETTVLVFLENYRMLEWRSLELLPGNHKISLPTHLSYESGATLTVTALFGKERLSDSHYIKIRPVHRFISLNIQTDKKFYKPGEPCRARILATDWKGRPVPNAEISLGVIHKALYWLRQDPTPDIRDFFHVFYMPSKAREQYDTPYPHSPFILFWKGPKYAWGSEPYSFGNRMGGGRSRCIMRGGGSRSCCSASGPKVRKNFKTTAHWVADLRTGPDGVAETRFAFPDDITEWRFTARGITPDTRVGWIREQRKTLLPLQVELSLPRAVRKGDTINLSAITRDNTSDGEEKARSVLVSANIEGVTDASAKTRLPAGTQHRLKLPLLDAPQKKLTISASVRDTVTSQSDAIERSITVLPRGNRIQRTWSGTLAEEKEINLDPGISLVPESAELVLSLENGFSGPIQSALDALIQYPYGCVEQTLNRFTPAVVAQRAFDKAGMKFARSSELPGILNKGLDRLAAFQHSDGGWGWWKNDKTNDFMTACVLEGLAACQQTGHPVPETMISRGEAHLFQQLISSKLTGRSPHGSSKDGLRLKAAHALAHVYSLEPKQYASRARRLRTLLKSTFSQNTSLCLSDRILTADTHRLLGNMDEATRIFKEVRKEFKKQTVGIKETAQYLKCAVELLPDNPDSFEIGKELLRRRKGSSWGDTLTNAAVVNALIGMIQHGTKIDAAADVFLNKRRVGRIELTGEGRSTLQLKNGVDAAGHLRIVPQKKNSQVYWSVQWRAFTDAAIPQPENPDAFIASRFSLLIPERKEITPEDGILRVGRGKTIEVVLDCRLNKPMSYLRISFPRPCGVELIRAPHEISACTQRDDGIHFFVEHWDKGTHPIRFLVRAEAEGRVFAPLPELSPMYGSNINVKRSGPRIWAIE